MCPIIIATTLKKIFEYFQGTCMDNINLIIYIISSLSSKVFGINIFGK